MCTRTSYEHESMYASVTWASSLTSISADALYQWYPWTFNSCDLSPPRVIVVSERGVQYDALDMLAGVTGGVVRGSRLYLVHLHWHLAWLHRAWQEPWFMQGKLLVEGHKCNCCIHIVCMYLHGGSAFAQPLSLGKSFGLLSTNKHWLIDWLIGWVMFSLTRSMPWIVVTCT